MLQKAPAQLDRVQVRRVGRQELHRGPCSLDELDGLRVLVDSEVVEENNVAWMEVHAELLLDELEPSLAVEGALELLVTENPVLADRANDREVLSLLGRAPINETLAANGPPVLGYELEVAAGLVDEDELREIDGLYPLGKGPSLLDDVRSLLLIGPKLFFFLVMPAARSERPMADLLTDMPKSTSQRSHRSCCVASCTSATRERRASCCSGGMRGGLPPPRGSGRRSPPDLRSRVSKRDTVASPTENREESVS